MDQTEMNLLEVRDISMSFGGLKALDQVSFNVTKGKIFGLIGPNGAGKTTLFNLITGLYKPSSGFIFFIGNNIINKKPFEIAKLGLTRTFQNIRLFKNLSVLENILLGLASNVHYSWVDIIFKTQKFKKEESYYYEQAFYLMEMFHLQKWAHKLSGELSYGNQRKIEMIRALIARPQLLCLDEPAAGMNHKETIDLTELIKKIHHDFNITILLIEHDMNLVMEVCNEIVVLDHGIKIAQDTPKNIKENHQVIEAYLGSDYYA